MEVYTLGHSNRPWLEFLSLLRTYGIEAVADIRAFPSSQRYPHFSQENLKAALEKERIGYIWLGRELGGYRKKGLGKASPNTAWESLGFRNFADHMLTEEFQDGVKKLLELARERKTAVLCAERFWWRCHRRLLSDWLLAQGHRVLHIVDFGEVTEHELPPFARIEAGRVIYPREDLWSPGCARPSSRKNFPEEGPGV